HSAAASVTVRLTATRSDEPGAEQGFLLGGGTPDPRDQAKCGRAKEQIMSEHAKYSFPKLHNAMWPGLVGKGSPGAEPCIDLDTMLDLTARAEVDGIKFDGVDIFLFEPHINIDISDDDLAKVAEKIQRRGLVVGSVVAPIWPPTGGGPALGSVEDRKKFVGQ